MSMNNEDLQKSLVALIDETLNEIEELKKSKFSADEIKLEGAGSNELAGKPVNGKLDAAKAEDKDHEEKETDEEEKKEEAKKAESEKEESEEEKKKKKEMEKGVLDEAEEKQVVKKEDKDEDKDEDDKEDKKAFPFKKSLDEQEALIKSYIDSKISGFETKICQLTDMVAKLADQPMERKGIAAGQVVPLKKSNDVAILSKTEVANKLFELKKSGKAVDTSDIIRAETGTDSDLKGLVAKYELR